MIDLSFAFEHIITVMYYNNVCQQDFQVSAGYLRKCLQKGRQVSHAVKNSFQISKDDQHDPCRGDYDVDPQMSAGPCIGKQQHEWRERE